MPRFAYRAKGGPREVLQGVIEAESQEAALRQLDRLGYYPLSLEETRSTPSSQTLPLSFRKKISSRDITLFTRQLSDLLGSGVPLVRSLDILFRQTENESLCKVIEGIQGFVRDGGIFSQGLARHPKVFSSLYTSLVEAGEVSGALEGVLTRLADFGEKEEETRIKVAQALTYPFLICGVGLLTVIFLLTFVIPKIVGLFQDIQTTLPLPTRILMTVSHLLSSYGWLLLIVFLIPIVLLRRGRVPPGTFIALDRMKLKIPLLGDLVRKSEIARFGRTLGTLIANGIPALRAIEVVSKTVGNQVLRQEVERAWREVREGVPLAESLAHGTQFPPFVTNMIAVGEESGSLERALFKVADAFDREVDRATKQITTLLEPFMILLVAVLVGFIVVSMLLPIFQLQGIIR
ncbi:MAG: type II secretion system F family protein [Candidatus Omnitrophica bacterium]|nr:type II secretion system F family protein [Candidatus Omnitrophota bacterium]